MEVDPQFYAVRWMTTLFARELPMQETLRLWEDLFRPGMRLPIVERERRRLVGGDFAEIISFGERCVTVNATCAFFRT